MKKILLTSIALSTVAALQAQTYSEDFNSGATDFTGNFNGNNPGWAHNSSAGLFNGVVNTGGVLLNSNAGVSNFNTTFDATTSTSMTVSTYFFWDGSAGIGSQIIGFTDDALTGYSSSGSGDDVRVQFGNSGYDGLNETFVPRMRVRSGGSTIADVTALNAESGWLLMQFTVTDANLADGSFDSLTAEIFQSDSSNTGGGLVSLGSATATNIASGLTGDSSVHAFFGFFNATGGGSTAVDNFEVTIVPEPSSYALISGFLALGWMMLRRRPALS